MQTTISQMIKSGSENRLAFVTLTDDINLFEFEDRKKIQQIVTDLLGYESGQNELVNVLRERGTQIIDRLLSQYENVDNVFFVGEYLRTFT